jgi:hypothetical protein
MPDLRRLSAAGACFLSTILLFLWAASAFRAVRGPAAIASAAILALPGVLLAYHGARLLRGAPLFSGVAAKAALSTATLILFATLIVFPLSRKNYRKTSDTIANVRLAEFRRALEEERKETGRFPPRPSMLVGVRLDALPQLILAGTPHPITREVIFGPPSAAADRGVWLYDNNEKSPTYGSLIIDCTHSDYLDREWKTH